jgi:hypothetical protein
MKNSNDTIGNRTRDLPTFSAVPQSTAPLRATSLVGIVNRLRAHTVPLIMDVGGSVARDKAIMTWSWSLSDEERLELQLHCPLRLRVIHLDKFTITFIRVVFYGTVWSSELGRKFKLRGCCLCDLISRSAVMLSAKTMFLRVMCVHSNNRSVGVIDTQCFL